MKMECSQVFSDSLIPRTDKERRAPTRHPSTHESGSPGKMTFYVGASPCVNNQAVTIQGPTIFIPLSRVVILMLVINLIVRWAAAMTNDFDAGGKSDPKQQRTADDGRTASIKIFQLKDAAQNVATKSSVAKIAENGSVPIDNRII